MEALSVFFNKIKELGFWERIFSWSSIKSLSYEAYQQFRKIEDELTSQQSTLDKLNNTITRLETENRGLLVSNQDREKTILGKDADLSKMKSKIEDLNQHINSLNNKITHFNSTEASRKIEYERKIAQLNQLYQTVEADRVRLQEEHDKAQQAKFDQMKQQWSDHELLVQQKIKQLCQMHIIEYVDKVPFRGSPDNTIKICDEFIIFDAKSPANEDLTNFPKYLKAQTENVKKYAHQTSVRKDIFLVVPSNTIERIAQLTYNMVDYNVYIITLDALEPIIFSLKKIEEYEFAEQLSPEERDNICRVIGKFAHTTKRKIQIDQFFANQFIDLLVKCKNDLPKELLNSVIEFEKADKLNPPPERRAKQILTKDLQDQNDAINAEAQIRDISIPVSFEDIKKLE